MNSWEIPFPLTRCRKLLKAYRGHVAGVDAKYTGQVVYGGNLFSKSFGFILQLYPCGEICSCLV